MYSHQCGVYKCTPYLLIYVSVIPLLVQENSIRTLVSAEFEALDSELANALRPAFAAGFGDLNHVGACANVVVLDARKTSIISANG